MKVIFLACLIFNSAMAADIIIVQKDKSFHLNDEAAPGISTINAKVGDVFYFMNKEKDVTHNVFSLTAGNEFEIKVQAPNNKREDGKLALEKGKFKAGVMEIECAIHPNMKLLVNITN